MTKQEKIMKAIEELSKDKEALKYINDGFKPDTDLDISYIGSKDKIIVKRYSAEDDFSDEGF